MDSKAVNVRLTHKVLYRAIMAVAKCIGESCVNRVTVEVISACLEDDAEPAASVLSDRDLFAAQAMNGLLSLGKFKDGVPVWVQAYQIADGMLAERAK